MELSIPANKIDTRNIYFMEKRKNVIVDGEFVKILYSTPDFEMNGLYIFAELEQTLQRNRIDGLPKKTAQPQPPLSYQKKYIVFNPSTTENTLLINLLCHIETSIIFQYIQNNCPAKIASYTLKTQFVNGVLKYHSENKTLINDKHTSFIEKLIPSPSLSSSLSSIDIIDSLPKSIRKISTPAYAHTNSFPGQVQSQYGIAKNTGLADEGFLELSEETRMEFRRHNTSNTNLSTQTEKERIILKIAGVWETATHVGITMKFISLV